MVAASLEFQRRKVAGREINADANFYIENSVETAPGFQKGILRHAGNVLRPS